MPFLFEKLTVYQKSLDIAERISTLTESFPRGSWSLADQLNRASTSISANIAEGNGRWTSKDRTHFFLIARGSAFECVPLLEIAYRKGLLDEKARDDMKSQLDKLGAMLTGLIKGTKQ
jgi:four helix bundle protein